MFRLNQKIIINTFKRKSCARLLANFNLTVLDFENTVLSGAGKNILVFLHSITFLSYPKTKYTLVFNIAHVIVSLKLCEWLCECTPSFSSTAFLNEHDNVTF